MQMKKVKEVLTENTEANKEEKTSVKKKMKKARMFFAFAMLAVNVSMMVMPVMASQATANSGADILKNSMSLLFELAAAFVSSLGGIQILWGVFEWGNSQNTQDGMMQSMSLRRIGGGLVEAIAPQIVTTLL